MDRFLQHCGQNRLFDIIKLFFPLLVFGFSQRFSFDKVCVEQQNQSVFGCQIQRCPKKNKLFIMYDFGQCFVRYISIRLNWTAQVVKWRKLSSVMKCEQMRINIFIRWWHRTLFAIIEIFLDQMNVTKSFAIFHYIPFVG